MSHTNSTTNYALPQFLTTDKPFWLTDINGAFSTIDTAIKAAKDAGDNAQNDATQALSDASSAASTASTADSKGSGAIASISDTFDPSSTYAVGDLVIYNNLLYKCIVAITTPASWDGTNWQRTTIETELNTKPNTSSLAGVAFSGNYNDLNNKPNVTQHDVIFNDTYNGILIRVIEYYNFYCCWAIGTATTTFDWHTVVALPHAYANDNIGIPLFPYDGAIYRGNFALNNGNLKIKVTEQSYVQASLVIPKSI